MTSRTLKLHVDDNVSIALEPLGLGEEGAVEAIPKSHKIATRDISVGENILRYGQVIGKADHSIRAGEHVHDHNMSMQARRAENRIAENSIPLPAMQPAVFQGYHRIDGRVGTRNYIGILTTVNCSGSVAQFIAREAEKLGLLERFPNVDGIVPIAHGTGCGMSNRGEGYELLQRTLSGYARHPNFGGVLLIGLGCEVMQLADLVEGKSITSDGLLRYMTIQHAGGTRRTVEAGLKQVQSLAEQVDAFKRAPAPASELVLGMQCGGSDGYSGFTANPALGVASDLLVRQGGTSILSETSEIYGAEHLLINRAASREVGQALLDKLKWWEEYCAKHGAELDNNPSPGNKRGGLTTILEKSLGAVAKAGQAPLSGVFDYAAKIDAKGLVFMDSPGYDPCSVTGQVASGATLIAFTTGRGSVSGYFPTPCIKLASNSDLFERMSDDMDVNCGDIVDGVTLDEKGKEVLAKILSVASGEKTKSEAQGYGNVEFVPWLLGAIL
ncbi:altronate hydrolase [Epibacterium ulvae]|uniref:Altronate hydrolase n=1 Tax=Epibacterium ulvae TaxID=1156985 RepID=A0A1G5Q5Y3_9RHOB|nr:altronate dehydratase family protein [Epibacterium ulvae]SCZ57087.1 altronate hydrolase [Epibacterium ulvae]